LVSGLSLLNRRESFAGRERILHPQRATYIAITPAVGFANEVSKLPPDSLLAQR
jgi:hypothetical protein